MAKKTLKQVIKKLNKDKFEGNVYIGGKQGSGFFYIGPYDKKTIQDIYDELDKDIRKACDDVTTDLRRLLYNGVKDEILKEKKRDQDKINKLNKEIEKEESKKEPKQNIINALKEAAKRCKRSDLEIELAIVYDMNRMSNAIKKYEYYKNVSYKVDIEDVTVLDYYPKTDPEEPGMIIIIEGCQKGQYWLLSEVEKAS